MKAAIISQARMTSTRLPGKVMIRVQGVPLLKYHLKRLKSANLPIFLATTHNDTDDVLARYAKDNGIECFRGDEHDVLGRFYDCASIFGIDVIVRVTSDCPLIDGNLIRTHVKKYLSSYSPNTYMSNSLKRTFPRGFDFEIFSFKMLQEAYENAKTEAEREHVTPYFYATARDKFKMREIVMPVDKSDYRLTLDTTDDLDLLRRLIEGFEAERMNYKDIIRVLDENPELSEINAHVEQKEVEITEKEDDSAGAGTNAAAGGHVDYGYPHAALVEFVHRHWSGNAKGQTATELGDGHKGNAAFLREHGFDLVKSDQIANADFVAATHHFGATAEQVNQQFADLHSRLKSGSRALILLPGAADHRLTNGQKGFSPAEVDALLATHNWASAQKDQSITTYDNGRERKEIWLISLQK
ncbi:MAG: glycosyltransferase family protein [Bacteroidota bacterium]